MSPEPDFTGNVTIRDIAKAAGVSISTVSRVLNKRHDQLREPTRQKVEAAIREFRYVPNRLAASLKDEKSKTLGMIVSNISNPYFSAVVRGLQDYAAGAGYDTFICNSDDNSDAENEHVRSLLSRRVQGLVVTTCAADKSAYQALAERRFPLVLLDRPIAGLACDCVIVDNRSICQRVIERLAEFGHRRIAVITPPCDEIGPRVDRVEGCRAGMASQGLELTPELLLEVDVKADSMSRGVQALVSRSSAPTALFFLNTLLAAGMIRELRRHRPLRNFVVVTYDDPDWCELLDPMISAVRQPTHDIGRIVARLAIDRIAHPERPFEKISLTAEFIERDLR